MLLIQNTSSMKQSIILVYHSFIKILHHMSDIKYFEILTIKLQIKYYKNIQYHRPSDQNNEIYFLNSW